MRADFFFSFRVAQMSNHDSHPFQNVFHKSSFSPLLCFRSSIFRNRSEIKNAMKNKCHTVTLFRYYNVRA